MQISGGRGYGSAAITVGRYYNTRHSDVPTERSIEVLMQLALDCPRRAM